VLTVQPESLTMAATLPDLPDALGQLRQATQAATRKFLHIHGADVEAYRAHIRDGLTDALARLRQGVGDASGRNKVCRDIVEQASEYVDWLQWSLWDLPYFAVALRPTPERFRRAVAGCGLVYLSARVFDDVIDRHFWYKGKRVSLLGAASQTVSSERGVDALTILAGLLLCFEGLSRLADPAQHDLAPLLGPVVNSARLTVIGLIMEQSGPQDWDRAYYDRLVQLKNVDYWRVLFTCLDPERTSPLNPFLERYYTLAQYLNDIEDFAEDQSRGQPNLLSIYLYGSDGGQAPDCAFSERVVRNVPAPVEKLTLTTFLELGNLAAGLPSPEREIAQLKLGESLAEATRLGVFSAVPPPRAAVGSSIPDGGRLYWYSEMSEVIEQAGASALQGVDCVVCGGDKRSYLFRRQGFAFHRCTACSHIFVSPRITAALQARIAQEESGFDPEDNFLEVQRLYAAPVCHLLRARAPGNRLLDIGFGRAYLIQVARAYFEVYGIDSSRFQVARRVPHFGRRLYQAVIGDGEIPWKSFDAVVMSHILEHLADPAAALAKVRNLMNPGGVLYVAVPDMNSLQFRVFGKTWDVVNPLVHFQYFTEASLSRLLQKGGFERVERVELPRLPARMVPRWVSLMRRLGGTDSGELAFLAHAPGDD